MDCLFACPAVGCFFFVVCYNVYVRAPSSTSNRELSHLTQHTSFLTVKELSSSISLGFFPFFFNFFSFFRWFYFSWHPRIRTVRDDQGKNTTTEKPSVYSILEARPIKRQNNINQSIDSAYFFKIIVCLFEATINCRVVTLIESEKETRKKLQQTTVLGTSSLHLSWWMRTSLFRETPLIILLFLVFAHFPSFFLYIAPVVALKNVYRKTTAFNVVF